LRDFFAVIAIIIAVVATLAGALAYQNFFVERSAPRPSTFTVIVNGDDCVDGAVTWKGMISSDQHGVFDGQGCGTQSWSAAGSNVRASFTNLSSYNVALDLIILKDGQQCFVGRASPLVTGSCQL